MSDVKILRTLGLRNNDSQTRVELAEFDDGTIGVALITPRSGLKPLVTAMRVAPETFTLLSEALSTAAHNPGLWNEVK